MHAEFKQEIPIKYFTWKGDLITGFRFKILEKFEWFFKVLKIPSESLYIKGILKSFHWESTGTILNHKALRLWKWQKESREESSRLLYSSTASERLKDLKVKRGKWKKKDSKRASGRERERPNGITAALWQRCRRVTWRIKWLSDPRQNWALTSARPVAPATLPCHSRRISAIRALIRKDNVAHENRFLSYFEMHRSSVAGKSSHEPVSNSERFVWLSGSFRAKRVKQAFTHACKQFHNAMHFQFHKAQEKGRGEKWLVSWSVVLTVCLRGELYAAQQ